MFAFSDLLNCYFSLSTERVKRKEFSEVWEDYRKLKSTVDKWLSKSSYSEVNLGKLFQSFNIVKSVGDPSTLD